MNLNHELLAAVLGSVPGRRELRAFPANGGPVVVEWPDSTHELLQLAKIHSDEGRNVCFGVASRRDESGGGKANLLSVATLFCDMDISPERDLAALHMAVETFPLPPSAVVASGNGLHVLWLLHEEELLDLSDPDRRSAMGQAAAQTSPRITARDHAQAIISLYEEISASRGHS